MKKILAKSLLVIIEAGLEVIADRIKKRRNKNGNRGGLDHFPYGSGAYDLRGESAANLGPLESRRDVKRKRERRRSIYWE